MQKIYWKTYDPEIAAIIMEGWYTAPSGEKSHLNTKDIIAGAVCYKDELPIQKVANVEGGILLRWRKMTA